MKTIDISSTEKRIRAKVVKEYMERNGITHAVCFSCGNASRELARAGVNLLDISPQGDMTANRWFTQEEIRRLFPSAFDATSGHLPIDLLNTIAERIKEEVTLEDEAYTVATGSGETFVVLSIAFPDKHFEPIYDLDEATAYSQQAPLNGLVAALSKKHQTPQQHG